MADDPELHAIISGMRADRERKTAEVEYKKLLAAVIRAKAALDLITSAANEMLIVLQKAASDDTDGTDS